jgi:hypothetical protein
VRAEPPLDFGAIGHALEKRGVRWVLIGGQAVRLYGSERMTQDWDIWIDPSAKIPVLTMLRDEFDLELSAEPETARGIVKATTGDDRMDIFVVRSLTNLDKTLIVFDDVYARSRVEREEEYRLDLRIPSIDDLIALKRMRDLSRDNEDIRWLLAIKAMDANDPR